MPGARHEINARLGRIAGPKRLAYEPRLLLRISRLLAEPDGFARDPELQKNRERRIFASAACAKDFKAGMGSLLLIVEACSAENAIRPGEKL